MDGSKLVAVGEDAYRIEGNSSYIKFVQKDNNLYYSPKEYYTSCIRVPWNEGTQWQLFVILSFIAISLIGFIVATVRTISGTIKKKGKYPILINLPYIVVLYSIWSLVIILFTLWLIQMNLIG